MDMFPSTDSVKNIVDMFPRTGRLKRHSFYPLEPRGVCGVDVEGKRVSMRKSLIYQGFWRATSGIILAVSTRAFMTGFPRTLWQICRIYSKKEYRLSFSGLTDSQKKMFSRPEAVNGRLLPHITGRYGNGYISIRLLRSSLSVARSGSGRG